MLEREGKQIFLHIVGNSVNCYKTFGGASWQPTAEVLQMFTSINPEMLFLWIYPKEVMMNTCKD